MSSTNWVTKQLETLTEKKLREELGESIGSCRFGYYTTSRQNLLTSVLPEISRIQTGLTDHGPEHISDVLENAFELLGDDISYLNSMELYCLVMSILFHDVGNFYDREEHRKLISPIFDKARGLDFGNEYTEEKKIILDICKAHCGKHADGSAIDTLKDVISSSKLERKEIRPKIIAPIVRLADELAEGKQRTSYYMLKKGNYPEESEIHHKYALSTSVNIDKKNSRICLTYHIDLKLSKNKADPGIVELTELKTFLNYCYKRIDKLNQERQYAKYFCQPLAHFKETSVQFNFWIYKESDFGGFEKEEVLCDILPIDMTDLIVPGDNNKKFIDYNSNYEPDKLLKNIKSSIAKI